MIWLFSKINIELPFNSIDEIFIPATFPIQVVVVGDGSGDPVHIAGDKLSDRVELIKIGKESGMPNAVRETRTSLGNKIFEWVV